jgi:hypothetical protein
MTGHSAGRAFVIAVLAACCPARDAGAQLLSIGTDGSLLTIEPSDGTVLSSVPITLAGDSVASGNGLAAGPEGMLFGLLTLAGQVGRELVTIEPSTGVATSIGNTGRLFAALALDESITLYGLTGTGGLPPATLYRIDMGTAASESLLALTNAGGHAMAFNPDDGLFYHATGGLLETVEIFSSTITPVSTSGYPWFSSQGMTYGGEGTFLLAANFGLYLSLTTSGVADSLGTTAPSKGLAFPTGAGASPPSARLRELRAWPNPLREGTLCVHGARSDGVASALEVYDAAGRLVRALGPFAPASTLEDTWTWDGRDGRGRAVPAGVYFVRLRSPDAAETARIVVLR